jgi:hypothetical protein
MKLFRSLFIVSCLFILDLSNAVLPNAIAEESSRGPLSNALFNDEFANETNIDVSGWISLGATWNTGSNDGYNGPVTFNDYADKGQLDQFYLTFSRTVDSTPWSLGGQIDLAYGRDAGYTTSIGFDDQLTSSRGNYNLAIPQAYLELSTPYDGLTLKAGHFYTLIGYEVVTAPDNFFYSHAYSMQYAEPFTHWGALASYAINEKLSLTAGAVRGFDNLSDTDGNISFLGSISYDLSEDTDICFALITGNEGHSTNQTVYSIVLNHTLNEALTYTIQHDFGVTESSGTASSAQWYSINNYFVLQVLDDLSLGLRAEWFRDDDGARVSGPRSGAGGVPANYYQFSLGANYSLTSYMIVRPELRYDVQDTLENNTPEAFNSGNDDEQLLISGNLIVTF